MTLSTLRRSRTYAPFTEVASTPVAPADQAAHVDDGSAAAPVAAPVAATGVALDQAAQVEAASTPVDEASGVFVWVTTLDGTLYE